MKPGRLQLTLVFSLLALAIAYNVWVFLQPPRRNPTQAAERALLENLQATGPTVTGEPAAEAIDPRTIPPVSDVELNRPPVWSRNPFVNARFPVVDVAAGPILIAQPEPPLVVASILHSSQRRLAIVNGEIVREGDRIGGATVLAIEPRAVVLETARGERQTIELRSPFGDAEPKASPRRNDR
jgi:hypothetical protein